MGLRMIDIIPGLSGKLELIILLSISTGIFIILIIVIFRRIRRYGDYAYVNARISAMKSRLFRKEKLNPLIQTQNLQNFASLLEDSHYSQYLDSIEGLRARELEISINQQLSDTYDKISSLAPLEIREIFQEMVKILEIQSLKTIIGSKLKETTKEKEVKLQKYLSERLHEKTSEAKNIDEVVESLKGTEYENWIKDGLSEYEKTRNPLSIWSKIEKGYWKKVWKTIKTSTAKYSNVTRKALGMKIDIQNILTVLRCKAEDVSADEIKNHIIPIHTKIDPRSIERAAESENLKKAAMLFEDTPYGNDISDLLNQYEGAELIFKIEINLQRSVLKKIRNLSTRYYSGAGPLTAFFFEKNMEVKNLTTIANGIEEGLESEEIEEKIIKPEV
ncbi:hypothetical protein AKJ55_00840 [candidate division MSBL1 archaeon SCGC-AAA382M17]|uniref:V-type ATP synthase subunit C n=1 Tax=candidate division MSBL1 archaeon SCGC-AAA382M17 TaxID=1698284 RepID=A0ABR5TJS6_9EURY|nr:hypothetical protein AKJ55_00840 [candidate division MSBL1 archaeon SCGC-AAA382M17]